MAIGGPLDNPVEYVPVEAVPQSVLAMAMGEWLAELMADDSKAYSENWGDLVTGDVEAVLGRPPRSIEQSSNEVRAPAMQAVV